MNHKIVDFKCARRFSRIFIYFHIMFSLIWFYLVFRGKTVLWVCFGDFSGRYFSLSLGNLSLGHGRRRFESPSTGAALADKLWLKLVSESINGRRMFFFTEDVGTKHMAMRETLCNKTGSCWNWETDILWNHNATWMIPTSPEKVVCIPKILISDMTDLKDDSEGHATNDTQRNPTIGSFQDFVSRCRILWSPTRIAVARPVWCNRFAIVVFKPVTDLTQDSNKIWEVLAEDSLPCFIID